MKIQVPFRNWHSVEWYITNVSEVNNGSISGVVFRYDPEMEVDSYLDISVPVQESTRHHVPYDLTRHEQLPVLKSFMLYKLSSQVLILPATRQH
jgi:hypothetical protein